MSFARYLPRFRRAYRALEELETRETWSRAEIKAFQLARINDQWKHAIVSVPHFRNYRKQHALPKQFDSLTHFCEALPITKKKLLSQHPERFLSEEQAAGKWHRTGGSTGVPMRMFRSHDAHCRMLWTKYRMEQAWEVDFFDRKAFVWGHAASFAPGLGGAIQRTVTPGLDWLRNRTRLNAYRLASSDLAQYLDVISKRKIQVLYGYSSAITLLAQEAQRRGMKFPHLKLAILTAEPADESMLALCETGFGAPAAIEYGSVECGVIATGMPDGTLRVREDAVFLETQARADGRYDLIITVLDNRDFPLLRYAVEDITDEELSYDEYGFAILKNVSGRSNDILISKLGCPVHPLAVKHAVEQHNDVRRFRAHQSEQGDVLLTIEAAGSVTPADFDSAQKTLQKLLEGFEISIEVVPQLSANRAGKHRWVTSDLAVKLGAAKQPEENVALSARPMMPNQ